LKIIGTTCGTTSSIAICLGYAYWTRRLTQARVGSFGFGNMDMNPEMATIRASKPAFRHDT
jgi:hypothetical protein